MIPWFGRGWRSDFAKLLEGPHRDDGLLHIVALTHSGMTTEEFRTKVEGWLATARHPRWGKPYDQLTYQANAGTAPLPSRKRVQDLHRLRAAVPTSCASGASGSTASRLNRLWAQPVA